MGKVDEKSLDERDESSSCSLADIEIRDEGSDEGEAGGEGHGGTATGGSTALVFGSCEVEDLAAVYKWLDGVLARWRVKTLVLLDQPGADLLCSSWAFDRRVAVVYQKTSRNLWTEREKDRKAARREAWSEALVKHEPIGVISFLTRRETESLLPTSHDTRGAVQAVIFEEEEAEAARKKEELKSFYSALDPTRDGTDYLNIYSKGQTALGRALSNFTPAEARIATEDGAFVSVEGYWYFLNVSPKDARREKLRDLSGYAAKELGRALCSESPAGPGERLPERLFRERITDALIAKLEASPKLLKAFLESRLPFVHFYCYGTGEKAKVVIGEGLWIIDAWEKIRTLLSEEGQAER